MNRSIGDIILIYGASLFASWTAFCYVMVFCGADFSLLYTWSFVPLALGLMLGLLCNDSTASGHVDFSAAKTTIAPVSGPDGKLSWVLGLICISAALLRVAGAPYWSVWIALLSASILVLHQALISNTVQRAQFTTNPKWQTVGLVILVILGATLAVTTHRSDFDDSQYLNFVVTALDFPLEPMFSRSGLWPGAVPLELTLYKLHSYELLVAVLSHAFDTNHKIFYYLILPSLFGGIAILVHWRLAHHLIPRHAFSVVLIWLVLIIALGETHRAFGNFAFVRLFQGKAVLVTVAVPLCLLLGLRFSETPGWRRALALGTAVVASLGLSSSALVTTPVITVAALVGGVIGTSRVALRRILVVGLASTAVLLVIGVFVANTMNIGNSGNGGHLLTVSDGMSKVLGGGLLGAMILALFPLAPTFIPDRRRRQIVATATLFLVIFVLNPWAATYMAQMLNRALQWRLFWSVPLVIAAAITLAGLAQLAATRLPGIARVTVLPLLLILLLFMSARLSISPENNVLLAFPHYKVEPIGHDIAAEVVRLAPLRSTIYAPISVAAWLPTFRLHPYPIVVRPDYFYFGRTKNYVGKPELARRSRVVRFLEGSDNAPSTIPFFQEQLHHDRPALVVYENTVGTAPSIEAALADAGYIGSQYRTYWLWQRPQ